MGRPVHADGSPLKVNLALSEETSASGSQLFVGLLTPVRVAVALDAG